MRRATRRIIWLAALIILLVLVGSLAPQLLRRLCGTSQAAQECLGAGAFSAASGLMAVTPPVPAPTCPVMGAAPSFGISLIDTTTGQVLCERNPVGIAQPASTTKVMAALL
ncbi:MAG TPA: hypothetical protein VH590_01315, partial [Ktedonobacterales bacterium]